MNSLRHGFTLCVMIYIQCVMKYINRVMKMVYCVMKSYFVLICTLLKQNTAFKHEHSSTRNAEESQDSEGGAWVPFAGHGRWAVAAQIHHLRGCRAVVVTFRRIS